MEKTKKFWRKEFWTRRKIVKWSVIFAIIIALIIGFMYEHYSHSEGFIRQRLKDNISLFTEVKDYMLENTTTDKVFGDSTTKGGKIQLEVLKNDTAYSEISDKLSEISDLGTDYITSTSTRVTFYTMYRYNYAFITSGDAPGNYTDLGDGWYCFSS